MLHRLLDDHEPQLVVLDAIASLTHAGARSETTSAISRELDLLKGRGITTVMTTLTHGLSQESSEVDISSLVDTWLLLRNQESNGERNRLLFVIKSRGSAHSNQVREFVLTDDGAELLDVYVGPNGVLTGSERDRADLPGSALAQTTAVPTRPSAVASELAQRSAALDGPDGRAAGAAEQPRTPSSNGSSPPRPRRASGVAVRVSQSKERSGETSLPRDGGSNVSDDRRSPPSQRTSRAASTRTGTPRTAPRCTTCASTSQDSRLARSGRWRTCASSATSTSPAATGWRSIDLLVNPALARGDEIVAVPTLVRKLPEPIRKIIGDLSDTEQRARRAPGAIRLDRERRD